MDQPRDLIRFRRRHSMVKVEDERIPLAAVDAGMRKQVREDLLVVLRKGPASASVCLLQILGAILPVVLAAIRRHAGETDRSSSSEEAVFERKHCDRLHDPAGATRLLLAARPRREFEDADRSFFRGTREFSKWPESSGPPVELQGRSPSVATRTPDVALLDLGDHAHPGLMRREQHDVVFLCRGIAVIEVQDDDVGLAAVHARMRPKVFANERPVLVAIATNPGDLLLYVGGSVTHVVLSPIAGMTDPAPALTSSLRLVVEGEVIDGLYESAVIATLGLDGERHEGPLRSGSALAPPNAL